MAPKWLQAVLVTIEVLTSQAVALHRVKHARMMNSYTKWAKDTGGFVSLQPVLAIVGIVLSVILAVLILAALAPTFFTAVADLTGAFVNADTNSTLANTILGIIAIIVPLVLIFGFIGLIIYAARFRRGGY